MSKELTQEQINKAKSSANRYFHNCGQRLLDNLLYMDSDTAFIQELVTQYRDARSLVDIARSLKHTDA